MKNSRSLKMSEKIARRAKRFILKKNPEELVKLNVNLIAAEIKTDPGYLSRSFKKKYGVNLSEYLINEKFKRRFFELLEIDLSVKKMTEIIGYESESHFIKVFKKKYAETPGKLLSDFF
jgi:AraC-like DNA-binding protein